MTAREPVLGVAVRSGENEQLTVVCVGPIELHACLDQRAHHRMSADSVIDVPLEVAVTFDHVGVLDEHHRAVEAIVTNS